MILTMTERITIWKLVRISFNQQKTDGFQSISVGLYSINGKYMYNAIASSVISGQWTYA